jgi:small conductance mechanosensitive channel
MFEWMDFLWENYQTTLKIFFIIAGAFLLNKFVRTTLGRYFKRESARINVDPTAYNFLKNGLTFIIFSIALLNMIYVIPAFKQVAVTLFAGAGILAAIIGFASQAAFSNIINGVMIVSFKPFRIGDWVEIGSRFEHIGQIEDITLRHTVIRNFENKRVVIPNSIISTEIIINRSIVDPKMIRFFEIPVPFDSDIDKITDIIRDEVVNHPLWIDGRRPEDVAFGTHEVPVVVKQLGPFAVVLRASIWAVDSIQSFKLLTDLNRSILDRLNQEGISIAIPAQRIHLHSEMPLNSNTSIDLNKAE